VCSVGVNEKYLGFGRFIHIIYHEIFKQKAIN
jgi:hypothetical protein